MNERKPKKKGEIMSIAEKKDEMNPMFAKALDKSKVDKKPASKKSSAGEVKSTTKIKKAVDRFNKAKAEMKAAEAEMRATEPEIIDFVRKIQDADGFAGDFKKSYDVDGEETKVKYVTQNRYSISGDDEAEIKELLGEAYDILFSSDYDVRMRGEVMKDPELQAELMKLLKGGKLFDKFFYTHVTIKAEKDYDSKIYNHVDKDKLELLRVFVKQYKASLS